MGEFIRFYSWGLSMKFHMAVYTPVSYTHLTLPTKA